MSTLSASVKDKIKGCIFGQAVGDALGTGTEFLTTAQVKQFYPERLTRYDQIVNQSLQGEWTDDTDMMLCIADSREDTNHFNLHETAVRFKQWLESGPVSIGYSTRNVLSQKDYVESPVKAAKMCWILSDCNAAANGALMRTSILGTSPVVDEKEVENVCRLTHYDPRCVGSCVMMVKLIQSLIFHDKELTAEELLKIGETYDERIKDYVELAKVDDAAALTVDDKASGYTLKTMAVALWSLWHCHSFKDVLLAVVNLGGDADTNAAVACAVAGAKYGFSAIPSYYVEGLNQRAKLEDVYERAVQCLG